MEGTELENGLASLSIDALKLNQIFWDKEKSNGIVHSPKGNVWNTLGVLITGKAIVAAEEALFLLEFHGFKLFDASVFPEMLKELNSTDDIMRLVIGDCGFTSYKLFKTLKRHGYILTRPECKYFPKSRLFEGLRGEYSLFKPSSSFKKTSPSGFLGQVLEIRFCDVIEKIVEKLEELNANAILAISDENDGFLFLEASIVVPTPNRFESSNILSKQSKFRKSTSC